MNKRKSLNVVLICFLISLVYGMFIINFKITAQAEDFVVNKTLIYEDFLFSDSQKNNTILTENNIDFGEEPHLHISYSGSDNIGEIYHQSLVTRLLNDSNTGDNIIYIKMRSKNGSVKLADVQLSIGINETSIVFNNSALTPFTNLKDVNGNELPEITSEYQEFIIDITQSYDPTAYYQYTNNSQDFTNKIYSSPVNYIRLYVYNNEIDLDITTIATTNIEKYSRNEYNVWNDFIGNKDYKITANPQTTVRNNIQDIDSKGEIIGRSITFFPNSVLEITHTNEEGIQYYQGKYLCFDMDGDTNNIKIYLSDSQGNYEEYYERYTDFIEIGTATYIYNIKICYDGEESVILREIYFTNYSPDDVVTEVPLIYYNQDGYITLDLFNAEQKIFYNNSIVAKTNQSQIFAQTSAEYRYSSNSLTSGSVYVNDSVLTLNAQSNSTGRIYNFTAKYNVGSEGYQFMVFKIKMQGIGVVSPNLEDLLFCFEERGLYRNYTEFYCGYQLKTPGLDDTNPYKFSDGYYFLVIDMEHSNIEKKTNSTYISMNYIGQGSVYIDEIFLTNENKIYEINRKTQTGTMEFTKDGNTEETIELDTSNFSYLEFYIKLQSDMITTEETSSGINQVLNILNITILFDNEEYSLKDLYDTNGKSIYRVLSAITSTRFARRIKIDLEASNIQNKKTFTIKSNNSGSFSLYDFKLVKEINYMDYLSVDSKDESQRATTNGYVSIITQRNQYLNDYNVLKCVFKIPSLDIDLSKFYLEFLTNDSTIPPVTYYVNNDDISKNIVLLNGIYFKDISIKNTFKLNIDNEYEAILYLDLTLMRICDIENCTTIYLKYEGEKTSPVKASSPVLLNYIGTPYDNIMLLERDKKSDEIVADVTSPVVIIKTESLTIYEGLVTFTIEYYDPNDVSSIKKLISDLSKNTIEVTKIRDAENYQINESVTYKVEKSKIETSNKEEKYIATISFKTTEGTYSVVVHIVDASGNAKKEISTLYVSKIHEVVEEKKIDLKIFLYIGMALISILILVGLILLIVTIIRNRNHSIKF